MAKINRSVTKNLNPLVIMQKVILEAMEASIGEIFPDTCLCQNCFDKKKIIQPPVNTVLTWVNVSHINTLHCIWCGAKPNI